MKKSNIEQHDASQLITLCLNTHEHIFSMPIIKPDSKIKKEPDVHYNKSSSAMRTYYDMH